MGAARTAGSRLPTALLLLGLHSSLVALPSEPPTTGTSSFVTSWAPSAPCCFSRHWTGALLQQSCIFRCFFTVNSHLPCGLPGLLPLSLLHHYLVHYPFPLTQVHRLCSDSDAGTGSTHSCASPGCRGSPQCCEPGTVPAAAARAMGPGPHLIHAMSTARPLRTQGCPRNLTRGDAGITGPLGIMSSATPHQQERAGRPGGWQGRPGHILGPWHCTEEIQRAQGECLPGGPMKSDL